MVGGGGVGMGRVVWEGQGWGSGTPLSGEGGLVPTLRALPSLSSEKKSRGIGGTPSGGGGTYPPPPPHSLGAFLSTPGDGRGLGFSGCEALGRVMEKLA